MNYKMMGSQDVGFLSKSAFDMSNAIDTIKASTDIDLEMQDNILKSIDTVIGPQEVEWISRHGSDNLVEYIVFRYKFKNFPQNHILEAFPLHLLLEPTSICNLRCPMCFQSDSSFSTKDYMGMMDFEFFKSLVDQAVANNCKCLTMASRGEPTLHKEFGKMLDYCKGKFLELKINTNATKLDKSLCHAILESGVDIVVFSVDSYLKEEYEAIRVGGIFEDTLKNIKQFCEIRNSDSKYNKTSTRISGVYLNKVQSKEKTLAFWENIVDVIAFVDAVPRWDTYNNDSMSYDRLCNLLWERMYVWYDGTCNPCDFDYKSKLQVGSAKDTTLKDIWSGASYTKYRDMMLQNARHKLIPCNQCNIF